MKTIAILITTYFMVFAAGFCSGAYMVFFSDKPIIISSVNNGLRMFGAVNTPEPPSMLLVWFAVSLPAIAFVGFWLGRSYGKRRKRENKRGDTAQGGAL